MEFINTSKPVTDITIPEGEVIKIEEASTGRVLWEKKLKVKISIEKVTTPTFTQYPSPNLKFTSWCTCVERDKDIIFFSRLGSQTATEENPICGRFFVYNTQNNTCSQVQKHLMGPVQSAAMTQLAKHV